MNALVRWIVGCWRWLREPRPADTCPSITAGEFVAPELVAPTSPAEEPAEWAKRPIPARVCYEVEGLGFRERSPRPLPPEFFWRRDEGALNAVAALSDGSHSYQYHRCASKGCRHLWRIYRVPVK